MEASTTPTMVAAACAAALACDTGAAPREVTRPDAAHTTPAPMSAPDGAAGCSGGYLPLVVGARWTYRVTSPGDLPSMKTQAVVRAEPVPGPGPHAGKPALRLETRKSGDDLTVSWMVLDGARAVRYAEESYARGTTRVNLQESWEPPRLRVDSTPGRAATGTSWREQYVEYSRMSAVTRMTTHVEDWTVDSAAEPCAVPARGTLACLKVRKRGSSDDAGKTYWFAPCVGKVKEQGRPGSGQIEELVEVSLP